MRTSWQRKWKNGCIEQGERLRGSSTLLVAFTDRYHLMRFVRNTSMLVSFTFSLCSYDKNKKWTYYLVNAIVNMLAYKAGFVITYYLID